MTGKFNFKLITWQGKLLFEHECGTYIECLFEAIRQGADLRGIDLTECQFHDCDFTDVTMPEAELAWARFYRCDMEGADFSGSEFHCVRFKTTDIRNTILTGSKWHRVEGVGQRARKWIALNYPEIVNDDMYLD